MSEEREFYVGYLPNQPPGIAKFMVRVVFGLLSLVAALAYFVPQLHEPYDAGRSDFRDTREFEGTLIVDPSPRLVSGLPGGDGVKSYLLVGRGKSGPKIDVEGLAGKEVKISGTLIYRESDTLISVKSAEATGGSRETPSEERSLGSLTLRGDIVGSKCYYGTMRPGSTKVHRACAARCILGGVPPVLIARNANGAEVGFLLADSAGGAVNDRVRDHIAEPVEITGQVIVRDGALILQADPETYRRL